jgi:type I restriction enzyme, S subunit
MRKVLKYPNYKESDVEWLGSIPEHWKIVKAKRILREVSIKNHPDEPLLAATQTKGVIPKSLYENTTVTASKNFETLKLVRKGDFVISLRSFQGGIEYAHYQGIISPAYTILEPQEEVIHNYYRYLLKSKRYISGLTLLVTGIREGQNIDTSKFKDSFLPLPPKEEQTAIARFLDYKLAKINRFIQKKKQLIKLLNEQKAAIINQAVTKGLDPNAKMKDSGIEWLGVIPEHWEWTYLRRFCQVYSGGTPSKDILDYWENGTIPWLASGEVNKRFVHEADIFITEDAYNNSSAKWIPKGSLIIALAGQGKTKGMVATIENPMTGNQSLAAVIPNKKILDYVFLSYYIESKYKLIRGFVGDLRDGLNLSHIKSIPIPILPLDEQIKIANFIKNEHSVINTTISKIEKELALTEEYKTALIAEAVTGKMDVRGYEVPEISEEETYEEIEEEISMAAEDAEEYQTIEE